MSIERLYYDLDTYKNKVNQYLSLYPQIKNILDLSNVCSQLCQIDKLFPPCGYGLIIIMRNLCEIIIIVNVKKEKKEQCYHYKIEKNTFYLFF